MECVEFILPQVYWFLLNLPDSQSLNACTGKSMLDDFADEVADIVGLSQEGGGKSASRLADLFSRQKVSQKFGAEAPRAASHGGDEDLPRREALQDRRVKYDAVVARRAAAARNGDDDDDDMPDSEFFGGGDGKRSAAKRRAGGEEDELYLEAKVRPAVAVPHTSSSFTGCCSPWTELQTGCIPGCSPPSL